LKKTYQLANTKKVGKINYYLIKLSIRVIIQLELIILQLKIILALIQGVTNNPVKSFVDDRGFLTQIMPEGAEEFPMVRSYSTGNFSKGIIRGFHKHKKEIKAFFVCSGAAKFVAVDDRKESVTYKEINTFILSTLNPSVLIIPTGVYTGWMSLKDETVVLGISSEPFNQDKPDDERLDPFSFGDVWKVKDR